MAAPLARRGRPKVRENGNKRTRGWKVAGTIVQHCKQIADGRLAFGHVERCAFRDYVASEHSAPAVGDVARGPLAQLGVQGNRLPQAHGREPTCRLIRTPVSGQ
jgi:hypothetical protein